MTLVKVVQGGSRLFTACGVQSHYVPLFHVPLFPMFHQALKARNMSAQGKALCKGSSHTPAPLGN
jgi:hypothetical protein